MSKVLALYTFGMFLEPSEHPVNDGFHKRNDPILLDIENAPGFLARSGYDGDPGPESWGEQVYPRFYQERGDGWSPSTLSLWRDMESMMAFCYFGLHAEALSHGQKWFQKPEWPPYVTWWIEHDHVPDWAEGVERHEYLHDHGPTSKAFSFKKSFDMEGLPATINRAQIKQMVATTSRK
jgi:hypothetical protein